MKEIHDPGPERDRSNAAGDDRPSIRSLWIRGRIGRYCLALWVVALLFYMVSWSDAPHWAPDSSTYFGVASSLRALSFETVFDRVPVYPLILLATGTTKEGGRFLFLTQLVMHFLTVFMLSGLLYRTGANARLILFFAIVACLPPYVESTGYVLTETATQFFLVFGVAGLSMWMQGSRFPWLLAGSSCIALSAMTRPTFQLLPFLLIVMLVVSVRWTQIVELRRRAWKASLALVVSAVVLIGGLVAHNVISFQYFGLTPLFGFNLCTRTVNVIERLPDEHAAIREVLIKHRNEALLRSPHKPYMYIWSAIPDLRRETGMDKLELSSHMAELNFVLIRAAPLAYLEEVLTAMARYWMPNVGGMGSFGSRVFQGVWGLLHLAIVGLFFVMTALMLGLIVLTRKRNLPPPAPSDGDPFAISSERWRLLLGTWAILAYTMLISTVFEMGTPRYRVVTDLLLLFAVALMADLLRRFRKANLSSVS